MVLTSSLPVRQRSTLRRARARARAVRGGRRLDVELLECRQLLSIAVDTFDDVVDPGDGLTSLREAISQAAGDPGPDDIVLPHEIGGAEGTYTLALGALAIDDTDPLTIESDGGPATVNAQGASQVFTVAAGSVVTLEGLVITGGSALTPTRGPVAASRTMARSRSPIAPFRATVPASSGAACSMREGRRSPIPSSTETRPPTAAASTIKVRRRSRAGSSATTRPVATAADSTTSVPCRSRVRSLKAIPPRPSGAPSTFTAALSAFRGRPNSRAARSSTTRRITPRARSRSA